VRQTLTKPKPGKNIVCIAGSLNNLLQQTLAAQWKDNFFKGSLRSNTGV
jgi:hypothetical protein